MGMLLCAVMTVDAVGSFWISADAVGCSDAWHDG